MAVRYLLLVLCLSVTGGYAQEKATLKSGTPLEVRVVSVLNKKGKREKFIAFTQTPVMEPKSGMVLIRENSPVKIKTKKMDHKNNYGMLEVQFLSVNSVSGIKVNLTGSLRQRSRIVGKSERREKNATNLARVAFGYFPTETMPKKIDLPEAKVTREVFVRGDYSF